MVQFEFLNGVRGFLAITVLMHHIAYDSHLPSDYGIFRDMGYYMGVIGFFILSSFLLTHRMLHDLDKSTSLKHTTLIVTQYFIRRFFRIYVPYFVFCTLLHIDKGIVGGSFRPYNSYLKLITLQPVGFNHLWTVGVEIKYYFVIPLLSFVAIKLKRLMVITWILLATFVYIYESKNIFGIVSDDYKYQHRHKLLPTLSIFLNGSLVAIAYYMIETNKTISSLLSNVYLKKLLGFICLFMFVYGIKIFIPLLNSKANKFRYSSKSGAYWSLVMFLMLIGAPNVSTNIFEKSYLMTKCGKYSFGFYLFHPMVMRLVKNHIKTKIHLEMIAINFIFSLALGFLFHFLLEDRLIQLANRLCKRLASNEYFRCLQASKAEQLIVSTK